MDVTERRRAADALRAIKRGGEGWYSLSDAVMGKPAPRDEVVSRLADLIDPGEDVSVSAYDLLPEEDREILWWVHSFDGGLDAVSARYREADYRRIELCSTLGIDTETGWSDAMVQMLDRLMPEGMGWPKYTDCELVRIGGCWGEDGCDTSITYIERIIFAEDGVYLDNEYNEAFYRHGERVRRPAVLAADGEPLEVGQTVWDANGDELVIVALEDGGRTVTCRYADVGDGIPTHGMWSPSDLTHTKPEVDTWQRIEEDLGDEMAKQQCGPISPELACSLAGEFVRRAKALAGVSE